jgi:hypothetical protein
MRMLKELPDDIGGTALTPASSHLFEVHPCGESLDRVKIDLYQHNTAKLLFLCKRARPYLQLAVATLSSVGNSLPDNTIDDYKKLRRVRRYVRGSKDLPLVLEADHTHIVKWWAMGKGTIYGTSTRQKMVTTSSSEAELVGQCDVMPQILWTQYFLDAQGYGCET